VSGAFRAPLHPIEPFFFVLLFCIRKSGKKKGLWEQQKQGF
jgi:hypothetical protein